MRYFTMAAAGLCLLAMNANAGASQPSAAGTEVRAPLQLAQAEPAKKNETVTQKVKREGRNLKQRAKRAWRDLTGYKFSVACPALIPLSHSICTETGKNREAARAKCQSQNPFCSVSDAK